MGHAIGYQRHEPCEDNGGLAPVMMQQTFSTTNNDAARFDPDTVKPDGKACRPTRGRTRSPDFREGPRRQSTLEAVPRGFALTRLGLFNVPIVVV